jgi:hypothetical protein
LKTHPVIAASTTVRSSTACSIGFHQPTSKDFSVSKLQKELKEIKLSSDYLRDLEIFWDSILSAFMNICQVDQAYHYYRDLSVTFTFEAHLIDSVIPP